MPASYISCPCKMYEDGINVMNSDLQLSRPLPMHVLKSDAHGSPMGFQLLYPSHLHHCTAHVPQAFFGEVRASDMLRE